MSQAIKELEQNYQWFLENLDELNGSYPKGGHVLVYNRESAGIFTSRKEALAEGFRLFGNVPFLVCLQGSFLWPKDKKERKKSSLPAVGRARKTLWRRDIEFNKSANPVVPTIWKNSSKLPRKIWIRDTLCRAQIAWCEQSTLIVARPLWWHPNRVG